MSIVPGAYFIIGSLFIILSLYFLYRLQQENINKEIESQLEFAIIALAIIVVIFCEGLIFIMKGLNFSEKICLLEKIGTLIKMWEK